MADLRDDMTTAIDVVIPVYGEQPEALAATLSACIKQTNPVARVFVVDDGSPKPVSLPGWAQSPQISLHRLDHNQGISAARNAAIALSNAPLVACINTEILPDPEWLAICQSHMALHPAVGACYTRLVPCRPERLLTRWRMRFLEAKFGERSGPSEFAPGHAVLFRREALSAVSGYDPHYKLHHEDSDICHRMRRFGWETHYVAESRCVSIQADSLPQLVGKVLRETGWYSPAESSLARFYYYHSKWTLVRAGRNVVKGRFYFLPVDAAIWAYGLWMATSRTVRISEPAAR